MSLIFLVHSILFVHSWLFYFSGQAPYLSVRPGYNMSKNHWISIDSDGEVPDEILKGMIDQSYQLDFSALGKTFQNKIIGG